MSTDIVCPRCGCRGHKAPHKRIMPVETAMGCAWRDMICGSCGRTFRSYPWPPQVVEKE